MNSRNAVPAIIIKQKRVTKRKRERTHLFDKNQTSICKRLQRRLEPSTLNSPKVVLPAQLAELIENLSVQQPTNNEDNNHHNNKIDGDSQTINISPLTLPISMPDLLNRISLFVLPRISTPTPFIPQSFSLQALQQINLNAPTDHQAARDLTFLSGCKNK